MCRAATLTGDPSLVVCTVELNDMKDLSRKEFAIYKVTL
jgi:hypothetical protein